MQTINISPNYTITDSAWEDNSAAASTLALSVSIAVQLVICLWTISANGIVLVTVCGSSQLRGTMTSFLVSLAAADFLLGVAMILSIAITVWTPPFWPCLAAYSIVISQSFASVWSLMGVAIDRYLHIAGHNLKWRITEYYAKVAIVLIWLLAVAAGVVPFIMHANSTGTYALGQSCFDFTTLFHGVYIQVIFYGGEILPVVLMTLMYLHIIVILVRRMRKVSPGGGSTTVESVNESNAGKSRKELKVILKLVLLLAIFITCVFPIMVGILWELYRPSFTLSPLMRFTTASFAYFNNAINPVLYWFFKSQFRKSCARLFRSAWRKLTSPRVCTSRTTRREREHRQHEHETTPNPSALPTINLSTYHCNEEGCKRTHHRENIREIVPTTAAPDEAAPEEAAGSHRPYYPVLPGMVTLNEDDITKLEDSTIVENSAPNST